MNAPHEADGSAACSGLEARRRWIILLTTLFTGFTALVYEVTWHRYLANFLGSQARAAAFILAVFLGGLSLGYAIFGHVSRTRGPRSLILIAGLSEIVIGLWGLIIPTLYRYLWQTVAFSSDSFYFHLAISVGMIGVPTVLMGGTLPLLTQGLANDIEDSGPLHARIYAVNTGGAFFGALLAGFVLLPTWGLSGTMWRIAPMNIIAGVVLLIFAPSRTERRAESSPTESPPIHDRYLTPRRAIVTAFLAGFYSITLQLTLVRLVGVSVGSSEYAFAMVVAVFILMLALGAWIIAGSRHPASIVSNQILIALGWLLIYCLVPYWAYANHVVRTIFSSSVPSFYVYHLAIFIGLALTLSWPVGTMGSTLPLLFSSVRAGFGELGSIVGRLYGWNTIGCVLGAIVGAYLSLYYIDFDQVMRICIALTALSALLVYPWGKPVTGPFGRRGMVSFSILVAVLILVLPPWEKRYLTFGLFRHSEAHPDSYAGRDVLYERLYAGREVIAYKDGPNTSVTVAEGAASARDKLLNNGADVVRTIYVNAKSDGSTELNDTVTMRLTGHLPMLLSNRTISSAAVVGFGLGETVGTLTLYPEMKSVHVIEIDPFVKKFSPLFDFANYGVSKNPIVRWSVGDAYQVLSSTEDRYDLIVSEPSNVWVTGTERLFTKEFYDIVRSRLNPPGLYLQWIHAYSMSRETIEMVMKTFTDSFPHSRIFSSQYDVLMIGSHDDLAASGMNRLRERYNDLPEVREALSQIFFEYPESLLAIEEWIPSITFDDAPYHTLEFPRLAYSAGIDFFTGGDFDPQAILAKLTVKPWVRLRAERSLIRTWYDMHLDKRETLLRFASAACRHYSKKPYARGVTFFDEWWNSPRQCTDSLIALALMGAIEPDERMSREILELLRRSLSQNDVPGEEDQLRALGQHLSLKNAMAFIEIFILYDNIFLPLSPMRLEAAATPCLAQSSSDALLCRTQLVEALARSGYGKRAKEIFERSVVPERQGIPHAIVASLEALVESAAAAEKALPRLTRQSLTTQRDVDNIASMEQ